MTAAAIVLVALVADDPAVLRNAPRDDAPAQATLWRGDWLEVRGETAGFLRVYDHRHERPGYIRPTIVRVHRVEPASTPELAAVVRFLRDANGSESLGIGYAALALRAAPAGTDNSEILAAIGTMAERLARRASAARADGRNAALPLHYMGLYSVSSNSFILLEGQPFVNEMYYSDSIGQKTYRSD